MKEKPPWLRVSLKHSDGFGAVKKILKRHNLHTVCEEADCPNIHECYSAKTATFLIMGDICTRSCSFCAVKSGKPEPLDSGEPFQVGQAVKDLSLKHVVITSVDRDDLTDGGANHFIETIKEIRQAESSCKIEILTPDFNCDEKLLEMVFNSKPDIFGFNIETVGALHDKIRPAVSYKKSLKVLKFAAMKKGEYSFLVKSGFMLGLGESHENIRLTLKDLAEIPCDIVTIGQYLAPTENHAKVSRYAPPDEFSMWKEEGEKLGISRVFAAPFVRSSYHAAEQGRL